MCCDPLLIVICCSSVCATTSSRRISLTKPAKANEQILQDTPGGASEWLLDIGPARRLGVLLSNKGPRTLSDRPCHPEPDGLPFFSNSHAFLLEKTHFKALDSMQH